MTPGERIVTGCEHVPDAVRVLYVDRVVWNPVDLTGRPKCFSGMHTFEACPATATRYWHDPGHGIFLYLCDEHAVNHETLPLATAGDHDDEITRLRRELAGARQMLALVVMAAGGAVVVRACDMLATRPDDEIVVWDDPATGHKHVYVRAARRGQP